MWSLTRRKKGDRELTHPLGSLHREVDRLLNSFLGEFGHWPSSDPLSWGHGDEFAPDLNVTESDREFLVTVELPGVDEKDVDLSVTPDAMTIRGEKRREVSEEKGHYHRVERSFGTFERTLPLPAEVLTDKVEASFEKGILTVHLPKSEDSKKKSRKITVKSG